MTACLPIPHAPSSTTRYEFAHRSKLYHSYSPLPGIDGGTTLADREGLPADAGTIEGWWNALSSAGLNPRWARRGIEITSACPLCGGAEKPDSDRFNVDIATGDIRIWCRRCYALAAKKSGWYWSAVRAMFPDAGGKPDPDRGAPHRVTPADNGGPPRGTRPPPDHADAILRAVDTWNQGVGPSGSPAELYLYSRCVHPPGCMGFDFPRNVRWLRSTSGLGRLGLPRAAEGVMMCAFNEGIMGEGDVCAVFLEALDHRGDRVPGTRDSDKTRWRRHLGRKRIGCFVAQEGRKPVEKVVLCEGETTALAARWLHPNARVLCMGGADLLSLWRPPDGFYGAVVIEMDDDEPGSRVANQCERQLTKGGLDCQIVGGEGDAADRLAELVCGTVRAYGEDPRTWPNTKGVDAWKDVRGWVA